VALLYYYESMTEITLTVSSKGQITLPKAARQRLGIKPGGQISLKLGRQPKLTIEKAPTIENYYGKFKDFWGSRDPVEEIRELRDNDGR
jgi:AbrB family looped-hinge helix DNA binding protein